MNVIATRRRDRTEEAETPLGRSHYVSTHRAGDVVLVVGDRDIDVVGITPNGFVIATPVRAKRGDATVRFRFATFEMSHETRVRGWRPLGETDPEASKLVEVVIDIDRTLATTILAYLKDAETPGGALLRDIARRMQASVRGAPDGPGTVALAPNGNRRRRRFFALAITVAAIAVFALTAYERLFVVDFYGFVTTSDVQLIRAERTGIFYSFGASGNRLMAQDELIGFIETRSGKSYSINSPCACYLGDAAVKSGSPVAKGTVVARVILPDAQLEVTSRTPLASLWGVSVGDRVELDFPSSETPVEGHIVTLEPDRIAATTATNADEPQTPGFVRVRPVAAIDKSLVGGEVRVRLVRARGTVAKLLTPGGSSGGEQRVSLAPPGRE